ncbi:hypothetical protein EVAR_13622_1 [Eumeta japonica]|uniref:Uncharacterized protein n=1 Tax=Eumeta variegata TaxID=151549 RepID=A0A4C1UTS7_EUMVA|nr:hypothetical protein EVAR_13622_1 [Eumeta japonica]
MKASEQINDGTSTPAAGATEATQVEDVTASISKRDCIDIDYAQTTIIKDTFSSSYCHKKPDIGMDKISSFRNTLANGPAVNAVIEVTYGAVSCHYVGSRVTSYCYSSGFEDGLDLQMDLIDGAVVGMSNGWTDWDEIFYVYSNGSLDDFKIQLDPVGGATVGISLKAFPGRTTSAGTASVYIYTYALGDRD